MPESFRSPRKRALEIGTNPSGFNDQVEYDAQAGVPKGTAGVSTTKAAGLARPQPAVKPSPHGVPFAVK